MQPQPNTSKALKNLETLDEFGLTERDVARFYGVSVYTVQRWRCKGMGPRWRKIGSSCRYSLADLREHWERLPAGGSVPRSGGAIPAEVR